MQTCWIRMAWWLCERTVYNYNGSIIIMAVQLYNYNGIVIIMALWLCERTVRAALARGSSSAVRATASAYLA